MQSSRLTSFPLVGIGLVSILSCGGAKDLTGTHAMPASVTAVSDAQFSGVAGSVLSPSPTFVVKDAQGKTLGGVPITITVTSGNAKVANTPTTTSSSGPTSIGTVSFGEQSGPSTITVQVANLPVLTITLTSSPDVPASIGLDPNSVASAFAGATIVIPVAVRDRFGNGIPDIPVTLRVIDGGGSISPANITSASNGRLPGVEWTFGKSAVPQTLSASGGGITTTISGTVLTNFPLELRFYGPPLSDEALASFNSAAARIRASVVAPTGLISFPATASLTSCGGPDISALGSTTGVIIYATVDSIDGPSKVLAQSGPCFVRNSTALPVLGIMQFDRDDIAGLVATGRLANVVLHEMLHSVGFGTVWSTKGVLLNAGSDDPRFTGSQAIAACNQGNGAGWCASGVPVENCVGIDGCGAGNRDSHWRESIFDAELMTGFVEGIGKAMPFSNITIQSLADLGYTVNAFAGDPYTVPPPGIAMSPQLSVGSGTQQAPTWEKTLTPVFRIGSDQKIIRIRR